MENVLNLARMDMLMLNAYRKNIIIMVGIMLLLSISTAYGSATGGLVSAYSAIMATYPFSIGDKYNIDILYSALPVNKRNVVQGRYLFSAVYILIFALISVISNILAALVTGAALNLDDILIGIGVVIFVTSIIVAFQMPIYFKFGYNKSKSLVYLPIGIMFLVIFGGVQLATMLNIDLSFLNALTPKAFLISASVCAVILYAVSITASIKFYEKREF